MEGLNNSVSNSHHTKNGVGKINTTGQRKKVLFTCGICRSDGDSGTDGGPGGDDD